MNYFIQVELHTTLSAPVREHHVQLRLAPWTDDYQRVEECSIDVDPYAEPICHRDGFGNPAHTLALLAAHSGITIRLRSQVQTLLQNPFDYPPVTPGRELEWIAHSLRQAPRLWDFVLHRSALIPRLAALGLSEQPPRLLPDRPLIEQAQAAMAWVSGVLDEQVKSQDRPSASQATTKEPYGISADAAHLLIALVRDWGIPARFATGYLDPACFEPDDENDDSQAHRQSLHAWTDVLIPGAGWRGFDPVSGLVVNDAYVRVAAGRDASDVAPERETFKGEGAQGDVALTVHVAEA